MKPDTAHILDLARKLPAGEQAEVARLLEPAMPVLTVEVGDVIDIPADGLITAVNSRGMWAGAVLEEGDEIHYRWVTEDPVSVDGSIQCVAGGQYHLPATALIGAPEGTTMVAGRQYSHTGAFESVIFVVDDLKIPLYDLVIAALTAADDAGLRSVSLPALRTGVVKQRGGSPPEKLDEIVRAACDFRPRARNLRRIIFVSFHNHEMADALRTLIEASAAEAAPEAVARVKVQIGDITRVPSDGLITAVNSEGLWSGGVDQAISKVAGGQFHRVAGMLIGRPECKTLVVKGQYPHMGAFRRVVFVVDDLHRPLYDILTAGLRAADEAGLTSVTVPAMRMGAMMSLGGPPEGKIAEMARAARDFQKEARKVRSITFVIYGDPVTTKALRKELTRIPEPAGPGSDNVDE